MQEKAISLPIARTNEASVNPKLKAAADDFREVASNWRTWLIAGLFAAFVAGGMLAVFLQ